MNRFGLKPETVEKLHTVFRKHRNIQRVLIYGSRAKGNYRNGSDIDLTLQGTDLDWHELQAIERELDDLNLPYKVDVSLYSHIDSPAMRAHIERWGIEL
jgi:predicted nucleotidyltransferase